MMTCEHCEKPNACANCEKPVGAKYYQGVPGVGDLCLECHRVWSDLIAMAEVIP